MEDDNEISILSATFTEILANQTGAILYSSSNNSLNFNNSTANEIASVGEGGFNL